MAKYGTEMVVTGHKMRGHFFQLYLCNSDTLSHFSRIEFVKLQILKVFIFMKDFLQNVRLIHSVISSDKMQRI
jgi:hypothetical protein